MTSKLRVNEITSQSGAGSIVIPAGNSLQQEGLPVQVVQKIIRQGTATTASQTYVSVNNGDLSITTKLNNSKILVLLNANGYADAGSGGNIGLQRVIGGVTTRLLGVDGSAGDSWSGGGYGTTSFAPNRAFLDSPNVLAGTTIRYDMLLGRWTGGTIYLNYNVSVYEGVLSTSITLMEIAQ